VGSSGGGDGAGEEAQGGSGGGAAREERFQPLNELMVTLPFGRGLRRG
jgi:hypothetical protein